MASDDSLLQRYAQTRDADAFAELTRRYAGLVYGACLRVTGNHADAEDVAQECFLELAQKASAITVSLPGWLHMLAQRRAIAGGATPAVLGKITTCLVLSASFLTGVVLLHQRLATPHTLTHWKHDTAMISNIARTIPDTQLHSLLVTAISPIVPAALEKMDLKRTAVSPLNNIGSRTAGSVKISAVDKPQIALAKETSMPSHANAGIATLDTGKVNLNGNGWEQDTFCLALAEATRLLGRPVPYPTLLALTTNAFAPGFDTGNDCKELWVAEAWMSHRGPVQPAWQNLGLSVQPLSLPAAPHQSAAAAESAYRRQCAHVIRAAMDAGRVVISTGGWKKTEAEPWWAGIITHAGEDGTILGAHPGGRKEVELADITPGEVFAVSLTDPSLNSARMHQALLVGAIARIRAEDTAFQRGEFTAYGVDALDEWGKQLRLEAGFCPACRANNKSDWESAAKVARAVTHRSQLAAQYLHEHLAAFPAAGQPHIELAAGHYQRIVSLLQPVLDNNGNGYRLLIGNLPKQREHVQQVLIPVKAEFLAAANKMEQALRTYSTAVVVRDNGKAVIHGMEGLRINAHNSVICTASTIMQAIGEPVSYEELMGLSAAAFRVQMYLPGWCPSAPHAHCGFNCGKLAEAALPYHLRGIYTDPGFKEYEEGNLNRAKQAVKESIDRGIPAIYSDEECSLIVGYEDDGEKWIVRSYWTGGGYEIVTKVPWAVAIFDYPQAVDRQQVLLTSLRTAVELAYTPNHDSYAGGFTAYEAWIAGLREDKEIAALDKAALSGKVHANAYCLEMLADARRAAAAYLRDIAPKYFSADETTHLLQAAAYYQQITDLLTTRTKDLPLPWEMYPWNLQGGAGWIPAMRQAQANRLQEVDTIERQAIAELQTVLAAEGVKAQLPARLSYTGLHLQGNGHLQDSFSLTLQAAAALLGKKVDYPELLALSTNGFAPGFCTGESCTAWWELYGRERGMELVAARLGLHIRKLPLPEFTGDSSDPAVRKRYNATCAPFIHTALDSGAVVITDGGWQVKNGPHGFIPWCWWGIITGTTPDGVLHGATLNGFTDNPIDGAYSCWAVTAQPAKLNEQQATLEMLKRAMARIRGEKPFTGDKVVYGLPGIDLWIAHMRKVPFCPDCKEQSWTCAQDTARTPYEDTRVIAGYLRAHSNSMAVVARPSLLAAAEHYECIAALLHPALTGEHGESYQHFMGDLPKQQAYADVIRQVKAEYAAIADNLSQAVVAEEGKAK